MSVSYLNCARNPSELIFCYGSGPISGKSDYRKNFSRDTAPKIASQNTLDPKQLRASMKQTDSVDRGTEDGARKVRQTGGGGAGHAACEVSQANLQRRSSS